MKKNIIITLLTVAFAAAQPHTIIAQSNTQMEEYKKVTVRDQAIEDYLKANNINGVKGSTDGFYYQIEKEGNGAVAKAGDFVLVHYVGTLLNGKKFDSSRDRNDPFSFQIGQGQVIPGWDKGIPMFSVGSRGKLFLPSNVAYGANGAGADIPPNTPLIFDIEVIKVFKDAAEQAAYQAEAQKRAEAAAAVAGEAQKGIDEKRIAEYIAANKLTNVQKSPDGYYYQITKKGTGAPIKSGAWAVLHYTASTVGGSSFDSSVERNEPFAFKPGEGKMIPGWDKGMQMFSVGDEGKLIIPSGLAFGARQLNEKVGPNSILVLDLNVLNTFADDAAYTAYKQAEEDKKGGGQKAIDAKLIADYAQKNNLKTQTTASGLVYVMDAQGTGAKTEAGKTIVVHYVGTLLDGSKFDSSRDRGTPFEFLLGKGQVIRGWDEGMQLFNVGGKGKLLIPSGLGYGTRAMGAAIPANSVLVFDIEVMGVK
jgi:FKBP-type peptidyl-prolyl cis-trans isomerase FkpA